METVSGLNSLHLMLSNSMGVLYLYIRIWLWHLAFPEKGKRAKIFFGKREISISKQGNKNNKVVFLAWKRGFSKNPCYKRNFWPKTGLKRAKGLIGPSLLWKWIGALSLLKATWLHYTLWTSIYCSKEVQCNVQVHYKTVLQIDSSTWVWMNGRLLSAAHL